MSSDFRVWQGAELELMLSFTTTFLHDARLVTLAEGRTEGEWLSPVHTLKVPTMRLNPSWNTVTPPGTHIECELRVRVGDAFSGWYQLGKWAMHNTPTFQRTSVPNQHDAHGLVGDDTFFAHEGRPVEAYQVRIRLFSEVEGRRPGLRMVAVQASSPQPFTTVSAYTLGGSGVELPGVPAFSQYVHQGEFPQFGGGEAWCSAATTAMVLGAYRVGLSQDELATIPPDPVFDANGRRDPAVVYAALHMYDAAYGNGNWAFAVAYAGERGLHATVRVLDSLVAIERLVAKGVPVVVSTRWANRDELPNAGIESTTGHLMVVCGFTPSGDVIAHDPATHGGNGDVRRVYPRLPFERQWLNPSSGGTVYVIKWSQS